MLQRDNERAQIRRGLPRLEDAGRGVNYQEGSKDVARRTPAIKRCARPQ